MNFWSRLSVQNKILTIGVFVILFFSGILFAFILPTVEENIINKKKEKVRELTDVVYSTINRFYFEYENERLTEREAKTLSKLHLWDYRYGPDKEGTFWIIEENGMGLVFPFEQSLTGKDMKNVKDPEGNFPFREMIEIGQESGEGFVRYTWQYKSFANRNEKMIAYVREFKPWKWIIGTGVYIVDVEAEMRSIYLKLSIITGITMAIAILLILVVARSISNPIRTMNSSLKHSDLSTRLPVSTKDEIGNLAKHFNSFVEKISGIIHDIKESATSLAASSEEMSAISMSFAENAHKQNEAADTVTSTIREITVEMDKITDDIDKEFNSLNILVDKMHVLMKIISTLNENTGRSLTMIEEISNRVQSGQQDLGEMNTRIGRIKESSDEMTGIISLINDISDQINLLSLNASIEAARAGETGRGFAVVAEEISKLADQTADSTKQINSIITQNDHEIEMGIKQVQSTVDSMGAIITSVSTIGEIISGIADLVKDQVGTSDTVQKEVEELKEMSSGIRMSTKVQKMSVGEINGLIQMISEGSENIASGSEELASSTEEVSGMADSLRSMVDVFKV
jgi:methyl-accepting chemotaxis protein